jgi:hypothetical protein
VGFGRFFNFFIFIYKDKTMSKEMRQQIDTFKNFLLREQNDDYLKRKYEDYLDYMYKYEEENNHYPTHLSNGQWTPFSYTEWLEKTKNGTVELQFP